MKQLTISIPKEKTKQVVDVINKRPEFKRVIVLTGVNCNQVTIYLSQYHVNELLNDLDKIGIGVTDGIISVGELDIVKPIQTINKKHYSKFGALSIEHIYMILSSSIGIDMDFVLYLVIATVIAGIGLATDDVLMVVASMLLSPLLNPLLGITYSSVIRDIKLFKNSFKTLIYSLLIVYTTGIILGLSFHSFDDYYNWPTEEMAKRGEPNGLITGFCIAIVSGMAAGISITNGGINTLVGVAIAASIHPPLVNSAICFIHAFISDKETLKEFSKIGGYSLVLFLLNVVAICVMAYIVFKVKGAGPFRRASTMWNFPKYTELKNETDNNYDSFNISNFQIKFKDVKGKEIIELTNTEKETKDKTTVDKSDIVPTKNRSEKEIRELLQVHMREAQIIRGFISKRIKTIREKRGESIEVVNKPSKKEKKVKKKEGDNIVIEIPK